MKFIFIALLSYCTAAIAQVQNSGGLFINDSGQLHISGGNYIFGDLGQTKTSKIDTNHGVLSFGNSATWLNASISHFIDGYVRTYGTEAFIAPIGDSGFFAPIKIIPSSTEGVSASYFRKNSSEIGTELQTTIRAISTTEYWKVEGVPSKLTLSWRDSSAISNLLFTPSIDFLTIVGYNGSQWVEIPSYYDSTSFLGESSSLQAGSISSLSNVDLSNYQAYTIGSKQVASCYPLISSSGIIKTWNGSWSPDAPTINDPVIINANYTGNLSCFSIVLNANITLDNDHKLDVVDGFTGTAKVIMSSEASLLQRNSTATAPTIVLIKITNPMRRYDYVFLSSPINNTTTFFSNLLNPQNVAVDGNFGSRPQSAFEQLRTYNEAGLLPIDATPQNTPVGRGFSATVRKQEPYSLSNEDEAWYDEKKSIHIKTEGVANNGPIAVTVPANGWVRIGNPYPSPINAKKLLDAMGPNVRKTLYYWSFNSPRGSLSANSYNNSDFATFNYSGGVAACKDCEVPTGIIATMQSVLTKALTDKGETTFDLTNCLRDLNGNTNFYRKAKSSDRGSYRLNLTGSLKSFSQILVAYDPINGTKDFDNGYDAPRLTGSNSEINSLIEKSKYVIQTRAAFEYGDRVPLQIDKRVDESFKISLATVEGVFADTPIYLHDKTLGVYHNLSNGSYAFVQSTDDLYRFEIVYEVQLSTENFDKKETLAFINAKVFSAQAVENISEILLYDLTGRLIKTYSAINTKFFRQAFNEVKGFYIAKIKLESGKIITQKLLNN
ncbi:hypothetical protein RCH18_002395 [Flavobacterium sp. PL11]|uniref:hypothetical protein n=1 Tax=Flavobacterium sp. PL11 TaxID=3071717 RepID=UPI002E04D189|nr:hypothetical protein [Flavobacterium sp. PL11]